VRPTVVVAKGRRSVCRRCGGKRGKSGADRPLVEEVTVGVDDVRLRELSLDERDDMGELVFSTVCAIGDSVHGQSVVVCEARVSEEGEGRWRSGSVL
jgi:hypothetical protein